MKTLNFTNKILLVILLLTFSSAIAGPLLIVKNAKISCEKINNQNTKILEITQEWRSFNFYGTTTSYKIFLRSNPNTILFILNPSQYYTDNPIANTHKFILNININLSNNTEYGIIPFIQPEGTTAGRTFYFNTFNVACEQKPDKCSMKDLKADFYLEQTKTNGETIIINTVPKTTIGVEHYWGILYNGKAPNCNCACEDISLEDIKNAKTVGVWATNIKSDGTFENIGIGTNVASGTSGYGIKYGGFPYYGCYKITHYIICDNRVESFTTCVGQSRNN